MNAQVTDISSDVSPSLWKDIRLWLLVGTACFLFADQNLMAPNLSMIADEFGFNALEKDQKLGGEISLAFWLCGGIVALLVGMLADRLPRKKLYIVILFIGEIPCMLTYFVETYQHLFWLRTLTGIGIGGAIPIAYSFVGDAFPAKQRARVTGLITFAMGFGILIGHGLAGYIAPAEWAVDFGRWRLPFLIVALPNYVLGILFLLFFEEPKRGIAEKAVADLLDAGVEYKNKMTWAAYQMIFRVPTNWILFLKSIPESIPWGVFFVFLNDYLSTNKGFSVGQATICIMIGGTFIVVGSVFGGIWGNALAERRAQYLPIFCGLTSLIGIIPLLAVINLPEKQNPGGREVLLLSLLMAAAGFLLQLASPNVKTMLLNVNPPEVRGSVFSLNTITDDIGKGLGPPGVAILVTLFGSRQFAFNIATMFFVPGIIGTFVLFWVYKRDMAIMPGFNSQVQP